MAGYILVAHQTAMSEALLGAARTLAGEDPEAKFVLLVPATPVSHLMLWEEGETTQLARRRAADAQAWLADHGLTIAEARIGDSDPLLAIDDLVREGRHTYDGVVLCTLPPGLSRWLKMDLVSRAQRHFDALRVFHVIGAVPEALPRAA